MKLKIYEEVIFVCLVLLFSYSSISLLNYSSFYYFNDNVLIEAIGLGKTVIAQDCKYGPKEIIGDSKWGYLIKEVDEDKIISSMALRITEVLQNKKYINALKRAQDFHEEKIFKVL